MKIKCIPQEGLKLLACISMLLDHLGYVFFPKVLWLRLVGRLAFPLYCFLLTEGISHTRSKCKYLLRLGLLAILAELPFDYAFYGRFYMAKQSVMLTLLAGAFLCILMDAVPRVLERFTKRLPAKWVGPVLSWLCQAAVALVFYKLAPYLRSDYGARGIAIIGVFMLTRHFPCRAIPQLAGLGWFTLRYGKTVRFWGLSFPFQAPAVLAMVPIGLYSGKKLTRHPAINWCFNLFYPVHLGIIFIFKLILK